ncbi:MAG TPA: hypothetical protein VHV54_10180 [Candidatus Binatia bacterium]|nr:hypothetical protein [Candidatus Binatia bacterium]
MAAAMPARPISPIQQLCRQRRRIGIGHDLVVIPMHLRRREELQ